jgi:hypothetical protein
VVAERFNSLARSCMDCLRFKQSVLAVEFKIKLVKGGEQCRKQTLEVYGKQGLTVTIVILSFYRNSCFLLIDLAKMNKCKLDNSKKN